jgi:hypothetical protein
LDEIDAHTQMFSLHEMGHDYYWWLVETVANQVHSIW